MWPTKLLLAALAYGVTAGLLFGDPLRPIAFATIWSDRLGIPYWRVIAFLAVVASAVVFVKPLKNGIAAVLRLPVFVILAVLLPTVTVGLCADWIRHRAVLAFGADDVKEHVFFTSIREAPADFQFFLHTATLKDCRPYAWSYRELTFHPLPADIGVNVLPQPWITRCGITRARSR